MSLSPTEPIKRGRHERLQPADGGESLSPRPLRANLIDGFCSCGQTHSSSLPQRGLEDSRDTKVGAVGDSDREAPVDRIRVNSDAAPTVSCEQGDKSLSLQAREEACRLGVKVEGYFA